MVPPATAVAATRSASDSNFRSGKENGSACYGRGGNGFPRPILIFVAAEKNGFAYRTGLLLLRFLISGPDLGIAASFSRFTLSIRASILDFRPRLANRCRVFPGNAHKCASILDFRPRLANRCSVFPGNAL